MLQDSITFVDSATVQNLHIDSGGTFPAVGTIGELFYLTSGNPGLYVYDGSNWVDTSGGGGGSGTQYFAGAGISINPSTFVITNTYSSAGTGITVQIGNGLGGFSSVPAGAAGLVLTSNGVDAPTWETPQVSGGTVTSIGVSGGATGLTASGAITTEGTITLSGTLVIEHGGTGATTVDGVIANILPTQSGHAGAALVTDGAGALSWQIMPGATYSAGVGITLTGTVFNSTVADNLGNTNLLQLSNGNGTLSNFTAGTSGWVLTSQGAGQPPTWANVSGTVSRVGIVKNPLMGLYIAGGDPLTIPDPNTTEITTTGSIGLAGVLSVQSGGTGATTVLDAQHVLFPSMPGNDGKFLTTTDGIHVAWQLPFADPTGNAGKFLTTDGTTTSWSTPAGGGTVTSVDISGGTTGLTTTGGPITQSGTITLAGVLSATHGGTGGLLPILYGGTGANNATIAINNLVPDQTGNSGKILTTNGTAVSWTTSSAGSVTSVDIDGAMTGLSFTGGPITDSGTFTLGGVLGATNGGTGTTSLSQLLTNLLPDQVNNAGKVLTTNGTAVYWSTVSGGTGGSGTVTSVDLDMSGIGLTVTGGPITDTGTFTVSGVIPVAHGGTGATTVAEALNTLLPAQTGNAGKVLTTNGTTTSWTTAAGGTVTSIDFDGGITGLTFTGGPITDSGTISLSGTVAIIAGGTGASSAQAARNNLLPSQTTKDGFILTTDGTNVGWLNPANLANVANGTTGDVQFNNSGALGASSNFSFDNAGNKLTVTKPGGGVAYELRSQSALQQILISFGRAVADEAEIGLVGAANQVFTGSTVGDFVIRNTVGSTLIGATASPAIILSSTGNVSMGNAGYTALYSGNLERFRFLADGSLSLGSTGTNVGTTGKVLTSNGAGAAPTWETPGADASALSGTTLAANVTASSLTSVGTLTALSVSGQATLTQYSESFGSISSTASLAIDCATHNNFVLTMTSNITTLSFTNVPTGVLYSMTLILVQDATGSHTITWPAYVKWANATPPTLSATGTAVDVLTLMTYDGGSSWLGFTAGLNF